jgi:uncharacterized protein (DUF1778 family)
MDAKKKKPGRRKIGRVTVTLRLFPSTKRLLRKAARIAKKQISDYAEETILERIKRESIE